MFTEQVGIAWFWSCSNSIIVLLFDAVKRGSQVLEVMREGVGISVLPQNDSMAHAHLNKVH